MSSPVLDYFAASGAILRKEKYVPTTENGHSSPYLRGDTELDRDVGITDFDILASNFAPEGYGASAVPEPSSLLLALLGLILLAGVGGQQAINEHLARPEGWG